MWFVLHPSFASRLCHFWRDILTNEMLTYWQPYMGGDECRVCDHCFAAFFAMEFGNETLGFFTHCKKNPRRAYCGGCGPVSGPVMWYCDAVRFSPQSVMIPMYVRPGLTHFTVGMLQQGAHQSSPLRLPYFPLRRPWLYTDKQI